MSTRKFLRELKRRAKHEGFQVEEIKQRSSAHFAAAFSVDGETLPTILLSCSPKNIDHAINNVIEDLQRLKAGRYATKART